MNIKYALSTFMWKFRYWMEAHSPIYINSLNFWKLISHWWKARKVFKFPHVDIKIGPSESTPGLPWWYDQKRSCWKLFALYIFGLGYKWKWDDSRHESNPQLDMIFCNKWRLHIEFTAPTLTVRKWKNKDTGEIEIKFSYNDMVYYEGILHYLYTCNKDLIKTLESSCWVSTWDIDTCSRENITPHLKKKYKIICLEHDIEEVYREYVEKSLENRELKSKLKELESEISHSGSDSNSLSGSSNTKSYNNLSSGIDRKVNDLS